MPKILTLTRSRLIASRATFLLVPVLTPDEV